MLRYLQNGCHEGAEYERSPEVPFSQQALLLHRIQHVVEFGAHRFQISPKIKEVTVSVSSLTVNAGLKDTEKSGLFLFTDKVSITVLRNGLILLKRAFIG
jgi:hypothetical protein